MDRKFLTFEAKYDIVSPIGETVCKKGVPLYAVIEYMYNDDASNVCSEIRAHLRKILVVLESESGNVVQVPTDAFEITIQPIGSLRRNRNTLQKYRASQWN